MKMELKQYVQEGARRITPAHLDKLVRWLPEIRLTVTQIDEFPSMQDQVEFLAELIEDFQSGLSKSIPYTAIAEAAFALLYLRKGVDIIPDNIPTSGYADDAALISTVFESYKQPFLRHVLEQRAKKPIDTRRENNLEI